MDIQVVKALDNIESKLSNVQDGDLLVVTVPEHASSSAIDRFAKELKPRIEEIRRLTNRQFGVLVLIEGVTVDVIRNDRDYNRLKTELAELKATVAKLANKK